MFGYKKTALLFVLAGSAFATGCYGTYHGTTHVHESHTSGPGADYCPARLPAAQNQIETMYTRIDGRRSAYMEETVTSRDGAYYKVSVATDSRGDIARHSVRTGLTDIVIDCRDRGTNNNCFVDIYLDGDELASMGPNTDGRVPYRCVPSGERRLVIEHVGDVIYDADIIFDSDTEYEIDIIEASPGDFRVNVHTGDRLADRMPPIPGDRDRRRADRGDRDYNDDDDRGRDRDYDRDRSRDRDRADRDRDYDRGRDRADRREDNRDDRADRDRADDRNDRADRRRDDRNDRADRRRDDRNDRADRARKDLSNDRANRRGNDDARDVSRDRRVDRGVDENINKGNDEDDRGNVGRNVRKRNRDATSVDTERDSPGRNIRQPNRDARNAGTDANTPGSNVRKRNRDATSVDTERDSPGRNVRKSNRDARSVDTDRDSVGTNIRKRNRDARSVDTDEDSTGRNVRKRTVDARNVDTRTRRAGDTNTVKSRQPTSVGNSGVDNRRAKRMPRGASSVNTAKPMSSSEFNELLQRVRRESRQRLRHGLMRDAIRRDNYFTSKQASRLVRELTKTSLKTSIAESFYPRVVDKRNYELVLDQFDRSERKQVENAIGWEG